MGWFPPSPAEPNKQRNRDEDALEFDESLDRHTGNSNHESNFDEDFDDNPLPGKGILRRLQESIELSSLHAESIFENADDREISLDELGCTDIPLPRFSIEHYLDAIEICDTKPVVETFGLVLSTNTRAETSSPTRTSTKYVLTEDTGISDDKPDSLCWDSCNAYEDIKIFDEIPTEKVKNSSRKHLQEYNPTDDSMQCDDDDTNDPKFSSQAQISSFENVQVKLTRLKRKRIESLAKNFSKRKRLCPASFQTTSRYLFCFTGARTTENFPEDRIFNYKSRKLIPPMDSRQYLLDFTTCNQPISLPARRDRFKHDAESILP